MKYHVNYQGRKLELEVTERDDGRWQVQCCDRQRIADFAPLGGESLFSLMLDTESYDLAVVAGEEKHRVTILGTDLELTVESEQEVHARMVAGAGGPRKQKIKSPMPGIVTKVNVEEGQEVEAEQTLCILEAMKMENEIRAKAAGTVKKVSCKAQQTVNGGDLLFEIE